MTSRCLPIQNSMSPLGSYIDSYGASRQWGSGQSRFDFKSGGRTTCNARRMTKGGECPSWWVIGEGWMGAYLATAYKKGRGAWQGNSKRQWILSPLGYRLWEEFKFCLHSNMPLALSCCLKWLPRWAISPLSSISRRLSSEGTDVSLQWDHVNWFILHDIRQSLSVSGLQCPWVLMSSSTF